MKEKTSRTRSRQNDNINVDLIYGDDSVEYKIYWLCIDRSGL
jgi:hypothetical protein